MAGAGKNHGKSIRQRATARTHPGAAGAKHANRLMDEVYRAMFQLESRRSGAEMGLALALLHACADLEQEAQGTEFWKWLRQICPICLRMIENSLHEGAPKNSESPMLKRT